MQLALYRRFRPKTFDEAKVVAKEFLNGNYVSNILRRLSKGKLRTYMLRHQFSTDLLTNNVDIRTVQELMGHTSGSMSLEYARSNPELMKKAIKNR